jgi:cell division septum initiation protein DivIVA
MACMDVTPQELRGSEIKEAWRGFNRDEVDDLLERAAATIENLNRQLQELESRAPSAAAALPSSRDDAEMLQRTLLLAQRAADDAVNEAQAHASQLLEESEARAQALVSEAEATARHIAEGERRRLEDEISDLSTRRDQLAVDADALEEYVQGCRDRVRAALEADLERLVGPTSERPPPRPELHDVEVPTRRSAPAVEREPAVWEPAPAFQVDPRAESEPEPGIAPLSYAETSRPSETEWPPPADPSSTSAGAVTASVAAPSLEGLAEPVDQDSSPWLSDAESSPEVQAEAPAPWDHATADHQPFAAETPIEAHAVETGDDLDDDAFFASLRDAVLDDAPLGPREGPSPFFDDEAADEPRGHFRRRR